MSYGQAANKILQEPGVELSTMMKTSCIRYKGEFLAMMFDKEEALIIKVLPGRVNELINEGTGKEFNLSKKRFKESVLIPKQYEHEYESYLFEALEYAKEKN